MALQDHAQCFVNQVRAVPRNQPPQQVLPDMTIAAPQEDRLRLRDLNNALRELSPELREVVLLLLIGLEQMSYEQALRFSAYRLEQ
jgi:DNA-directed RNA polymerase specialized sigma24 family protein